MKVTIPDNKTLTIHFDTGLDLVHFQLAIEWIARNSDKINALKPEEQKVLDKLAEQL
jgi:hypothetical protein